MIHDFSDAQIKRFAATTNTPVLSMRVDTWQDDGAFTTYLLEGGKVVTFDQRRRDYFFHAKKKLLYLQFPENEHVTDKALAAFMNREDEHERLRKELEELREYKRRKEAEK